MRRLFKALAWGGGILAALLIAAALYIFLIFDPNQYKAEITAAARKATGRELTIQGDLKLSLFPWLGVETGAMTLNNLPGFGPQPFAKIAGAAIKVKLLPLLHKEVEVDTVTLDGFYLNLLRTAAGPGNWEVLTAAGGKQQPAAPTAAADAAAPVLAAFTLGGIRIQNATIIWDDRQHRTRYELHDLTLHTGPIGPTTPVTLAVTTQLISAAPALSAQLDLNTQARYDFATQRLGLRDLKLKVTTRGQALPADEATFTLSSDAAFDLPAQRYQLSKLRLQATLRGERLPGKQVTAALDADVTLDLDKGELHVAPLSVTAWNVKARGSLQGRGLLAAPRFSGALTVPEFNARELLSHFNSFALNTADKQALGTVRADLEFNAAGSGAELTRFSAQLDQTRINGTASISNFSRPAYRFQLAVDDIDADRYLPPAAAANPKPAPPAAAAGAAATELPLATLRALDVDGKLNVGKLKIAGLTLRDIKVGVNAAGGLIRAKPLEAQLYGGSYRGDLRLDARGTNLQLGMDEALNAIEIGPLTRDLLQKDLIAGTGNLRLQLSGTGLSPDELKRTVSGNIGFALQNGRVNGLNLLDLIQKDYVKYVQSLAIDAGRLNQTVFSKFAATAAVNKGLITTNDLLLDSAQLHVKGRGTANLVDGRLAMHLDATPVGQLARQLGQFKDTVIPIRIEGTFGAPRFATDLDEVLKQQLKARLDKEKQKAQEELRRKAEAEQAKLQQKLKQEQDKAEKKLQEQLQNKLKNLFK